MQYIYKIRAGSFIKIGITYDVKSRIAQLQTGSPYRLELLSCYGFEDATIVERALHQAFSKERGVGEWFTLTDKQMNDFEFICQTLGGEKIFFNEDISEDEVKEVDEITTEWINLSVDLCLKGNSK